MKINHIHEGDCLEGLILLPDESVDCCVTSPPYFGLRDYGTAKWVGGDEDCTHIDKHIKHGGCRSDRDQSSQIFYAKDVCKSCGAVREDGQIGLEETPEQYVSKMVEVFTKVKRVLKPDGTLWLNLGDSYAGSGKGRNGDGIIHESALSAKQGTHLGTINGTMLKTITPGCKPKPKDLIGIPWMVAFALRSAGWYLRQDIIWHKPNPMPESVTDRCTKSHEYIFLLSKSSKYYYDADAIKSDAVTAGNIGGFTGYQATAANVTPSGNQIAEKGKLYVRPETANKRSVWTITTKPFSEAHFATFPEDLIVDMIKAGCPEDGIVLDPFMGAGTTALVASKLNRNFIGFELNPEYIKIAKKRLQDQLGMFNKLTY